MTLPFTFFPCVQAAFCYNSVMFRLCSSPRCRKAFTLIELLVVIVIIGILAAIALPVYSQFTIKSQQTQTLSNMRQVGAAFLLYAGDNNNSLPPRVRDQGQDHWPALLKPYVQNLKIYNSPIPGYIGTAYQVTDPTQIISNIRNNTDYIYNGWNEFGTYTNAAISVRLSMIPTPSQTVLLSIQYPGSTQYYMDQNEGNQLDIVDKTAWTSVKVPAGTISTVGSSIYVFCDGSSRMLQNSTADPTKAPPSADYYTDWLWLANKSDPNGLQ